MFLRTTALLASATIVMAVAVDAQASPVYGEYVGDGNLTGSRSVGNGLEVVVDNHPTQGPGNWDTGLIEWEITIDWASLTAHYKYTFSGFMEAPSISHLVLDLTPDAVGEDDLPADPNAVTNVKVDGVDVSALEFGSKSGIDTGVKIDVGVNGDGGVYEFTSNRLPVWGDIVVEAGSPNDPHMKVVNTGFGDQTLEDVIHYIARPNSVILPSPAAAGAGLLLLGGMLMRRRSRTDADAIG